MRGGGAQNCFVRPLALGLDAEMSADFFKGDLDLPATDEPGEDVARISVEVGRQEGLRVEFAGRIADQEPTDRHRIDAAAIPQRGSGSDLDKAVGPAVPQANAAALPRQPAIRKDGGELFVRFAFLGRSPPTLVLWWRDVEQLGIHAQAGDDADVATNCIEELYRCERTVGDQDNIASGEPATDLQGRLAGPVEQGLGRPPVAD